MVLYSELFQLLYALRLGQLQRSVLLRQFRVLLRQLSSIHAFFFHLFQPGNQLLSDKNKQTSKPAAKIKNGSEQTRIVMCQVKAGLRAVDTVLPELL